MPSPGVILPISPIFLLASAAIISGTAAYGSSVACTNSSTDPSAVQSAINSGGTAAITGTCAIGNSQINVNNAVTVTGGAEFVSSSTRFSFNVNVDHVTFTGMTFTGAAVHVTGAFNVKRSQVNFINNTFRNFTGNGPGAILWIDPIHQNSRITGNTFQNIWYGGFSNTNRSNVCSLGGAGMCNNGNQSLLLHAILFHGGLDNTAVEYNTFTQISGNAIKLFANGLQSATGGYEATNVSFSYNTFSYIHRIAIELQNWDSNSNCVGNGGKCQFSSVFNGLKIAGNLYYHPAYAWTEAYAYSLPLLVRNCQYVNNAAIGDYNGNATSPVGRLGYAFETQPGYPGGGGLGTGIWNGNVISGDPVPGQTPPGWYEPFVTYNPPPQPVYYQNNLMCGASSNTDTSQWNKSNQIARYNYITLSCPAGSGTSLWKSNVQAVWSSANNQYFASGGNGTWNVQVAAAALPVRYVQFFIDGSSTPAVTQEVQDVNTNFSSNRQWLYHATINTSTVTTGSHVITAKITDVSGGWQKTTQSFIVGSASSPASQLNPTSVSFGSQTIGLKAAPQTVALKNAGAGVLTINSIALSGANAADFSTISSCGASLAAGSSCTINIAFTPSMTGSERTSLLINDNAAGSPHSTTLSGTGVAGSSPDPPPSTPTSATLPKNLPKGMLLWLANDAGLVLSDKAVSAWQDQSGNGNDALQPNAANQPTVVAGNNQENALHFNGTSTFLSIPSLPIEGLTGMTVFLVSANSKDESSAAGYGAYAFLTWPETATWGATYFGSYQTSSHFRFGTTQTGNENTYPMLFPRTNSFGLSEWMHTGTTDSMWINAQSASSYSGKWDSIIGTGPSALLGQGLNKTFYPGDISEVIVYSRSLSSSERNLVERYLMTKYHL